MSIAQSDKNLSVFSASENSEATIAIKIYDSIIAELRCPSCACPMETPIKLCENGHSACNLCIKILAKCPLCFKPFTEIRSLTLEAVSAKAQFKCSNSFLGCPARLQINLLKKHEEQCAYQLADCFMGKVWENCKWHGREMDWIDHCELHHREKVFFGAEVTRAWELRRNHPTPICSFFIFRVFDETFNFYQIYDNLRSKLCWTMVCASKNPCDAKRYSFEIELFSLSDETKISVQRNPCHSNIGADILSEGKCAIFGVGDIMRFLDDNRILHYRIKVRKNSLSKRASSVNVISDDRSRYFEPDFSKTNIQGSNCKKIPSENIITRRSTSSTNFLKELLTDTPKTSLRLSSKESSNTVLKNQKEVLKSSLKNSATGGLRRILSNSSANVFKLIKFGDRENISVSSSQSEPPSPVKTPSWERIIKADSIDKTIIANNDLKKIFVHSYNIDNLLDESSMSLNHVNSIRKPPRISLEIERKNNDEVQTHRSSIKNY